VQGARGGSANAPCVLKVQGAIGGSAILKFKIELEWTLQG